MAASALGMRVLVPVAGAEDASPVAPACGETVRLDEPGGPLAGARTQSQDGLGTCASNTLALMLEGALPEHPPVSFLDLAFHDQDVKDQAFMPKPVKSGAPSPSPSPSASPERVLSFWGAHVCEQFDQIKEAGGVCPRGAVALESAVGEAQAGTRLEAGSLKIILEGYGVLFDEGMGTDEANRIWQAEIAPLLGASGAAIQAACHGAVKGQMGLEGVVQALQDELREELATESEMLARNETRVLPAVSKYGNQEEVEALKGNIAASKTHLRELGDAVRYFESLPLATIESAFYEKAAANSASFDPFLRGTLSMQEWNDAAEERVRTWILDAIPADAPVSREELASVLNGLIFEISRLAAQLSIRANPRICEANAYFDWRKALPPASCGAQELREPALALAQELVSSGLDPEAFLSALPGARTTPDATDWFMENVAPQCVSTANRIPLPPTLECHGDAWAPPANISDPESPERVEALRTFDEQVRGGLLAGRPQGVSICSGVLQNFEVDELHGQKNDCEGEDAVKDHGHHAVTVIGFRETPDASVAGGCRRELLVQNSWGVDWCDEHVDLCTPDGKLWIPEDALARNAYRVSELVDRDQGRKGRAGFGLKKGQP